MNAAESLGIESAFMLLLLASLAAVQARSVRGAQRHRIQDLCRRAGVPSHCDEIVAASETIAFVAASVVVIAAVVATLLAGIAQEFGWKIVGTVADSWPMIVLVVLGIFLTLQLLPLLVGADRNDDGPAAPDGGT